MSSNHSDVPHRDAPHAKTVARPLRSSQPSKRTIIILSITSVLVVAAIVASILYFSRSQIDSSRYQAVFLSNGQVYFGKLHDYYTSRPYLTDVYYIKGGTSETVSADTNQQLVRLGTEIHTPDDTIILNKSSILFVENLKADGNVMKLIEEDTQQE